jgi:hypothetical protein
MGGPVYDGRLSGPVARMLALIQRVTHASVVVDGETVGAIGPGLLALVGVEPGDGQAQVAKLGDRLLRYRVFSDEAGKMNLSLADTRARACDPASARRRARWKPSISSANWSITAANTIDQQSKRAASVPT